MPGPGHIKKPILRSMWVVVMAVAWVSADADSPRASVFRGINLNGSQVIIDGKRGKAGDSKTLKPHAFASESKEIPLVPPTDPERARMIRSSRWNSQVDMRFTNIPKGIYSLCAYVWE